MYGTNTSQRFPDFSLCGLVLLACPCRGDAKVHFLLLGRRFDWLDGSGSDTLRFLKYTGVQEDGTWPEPPNARK